MKVKVIEQLVRPATEALYRKKLVLDNVTANDLAVLFCNIYTKQFGKNVNDPDNVFYINVKEAMQHQLDRQNYDWENDPDGLLNY